MYGGRSLRVDPYQAALAELRQLDLVEVEGARVRARVRWVEEGECSSSYFCKSLLSGIWTMLCILVARAFNLFCLPSMPTVSRRRRLALLLSVPSV